MNAEQFNAQDNLLGKVNSYIRLRSVVIGEVQRTAIANAVYPTPMDIEHVASDLKGDVEAVKKALATSVKPTGIVKGILAEIIGGFPGNVTDAQVQIAQERLCFNLNDTLVADVAKAAISPAIVKIVVDKLRLINPDVDIIANEIDDMIIKAIEDGEILW